MGTGRLRLAMNRSLFPSFESKCRRSTQTQQPSAVGSASHDILVSDAKIYWEIYSTDITIVAKLVRSSKQALVPYPTLQQISIHRHLKSHDTFACCVYAKRSHLLISFI